MKRSLFFGAAGSGLVAATGAAALAAPMILKPRSPIMRTATSTTPTVGQPYQCIATLNNKPFLLYTRTIYTNKVVFVRFDGFTFTYTKGCNVSNVAGVRVTSPTTFTAPTGAGTINYDTTSGITTAHYPVVAFNPTYQGPLPEYYQKHGAPGGPQPLVGVYMDYDETYTAVEFSFATAAVCLAVAAFEATPLGWAALGIGLICWGLSANDVWNAQ